MLTIKNQFSIIGERIPKSNWTIKGIDEVNGYRPNTNTYRNYYEVLIQNGLKNDTQSCLLNRNKTHIDGYDWYELTCIRKGKEYKEILMLRDIQKKRWFIDFISKVAVE